MTIWPVAAIRRTPGAPAGCGRRLPIARAAVNLALLLWFTAELFNGPSSGWPSASSPRYQAVWPLVVVLTVVTAQLRVSEPAAAEETVRSS